MVAPNSARTSTSRRQLATSWWGRAFIDAMEQLDETGRMARGRTYARAGHVLDMTIAPGVVAAAVQGSAERPYKVRVRMAVVDAADREQLHALVAASPELVAALLAGRLPERLEADARAAGIPLLPQRARELTYECTCPDWGDPCKHAAAVVYLVGQRLDTDPFALLELRGLTRQELMGAVVATGILGASARTEPPDPHLLPAQGFTDLAGPLPPPPPRERVQWAIRDLDHAMVSRGTSTIELWLTDLYQAFAPDDGLDAGVGAGLDAGLDAAQVEGPVADPTEKPAADPVADPVADSAADPVADSAADPVAKQVVKRAPDGHV